MAEVDTLMGEDSWGYIGQREYRNGDQLGSPTGSVINQTTVMTGMYLMLN